MDRNEIRRKLKNKLEKFSPTFKRTTYDEEIEAEEKVEKQIEKTVKIVSRNPFNWSNIIYKEQDEIVNQIAESFLNSSRTITSSRGVFLDFSDKKESSYIPRNLTKSNDFTGMGYSDYINSEQFGAGLTYGIFLEAMERKKLRKEQNESVEVKKNYYEVDAVNYSSLAAIAIGPQYYKSRNDDNSEDKEHFIIGTCVDILLTEPESFDSKFAVDTLEEFTNFPTPQMKKYVEVFIETGSSEKAYEAVGFKKSNILSVIDKYESEGKDYAEYLLKKKEFNEKNKDKKILTQEDYLKCKAIADSLKGNKFTKKYFIESTKEIEVLNQFEHYWEMLGTKFKCKLDKVIINHIDKTIQPIDIKTTGKHTSKFMESFINFRYDIQASIYYQGICDYIWKKSENLKGYSILPFKFIVESTKYIGTPLIYNVNPRIIDQAYEGYFYRNTEMVGWHTLLKELEWHKEYNVWDYSRKVFENDGQVEVEL